MSFFHFVFIFFLSIWYSKQKSTTWLFTIVTCFILFKSSEAVKTDYRNEEPSEAVIQSWFVEYLPQKKVGIFLEKYLFWRPILMKSQGNLYNFTGTGLQRKCFPWNFSEQLSIRHLQILAYNHRFFAKIW